MKSRLILVFASLLAPLPASSADQPPLGRLFFTPEKRLALERQRSQNVKQVQVLQGSTMSLDGVVHRSSGKSTVWINQQAQHENDQPRTGIATATSPRDPGRAVITPGEDLPVELNVGEAMNRTTGERNTRLGGGSVVTPARSGR